MRISIILLFLALGLTACNPGEQKITIGYVQITQDQVLDAAKAGVFRALSDSGFVDGVNIKILENNAQGDLSMINTILQGFISKNVDLILTNSTPCMSAAAYMVENIPVVFTVAFGPEQIGMKSAPANLAGVYDPLHSKEIIEMMKECLPGMHRVGMPYNNAEPNAEYAAKIMSEALNQTGIETITASVTSPNDILMAGQYLAGKDIDAFLVAGDNTVYMGLNALGKIASETDIPLFVTDPLQAEKGAAIGYGVNYDQWGYMSGLKAVDILKGRTPAIMIEPIQEINLIVNLKAAQDQGITIPESVKDKALRIINPIK